MKGRFNARLLILRPLFNEQVINAQNQRSGYYQVIVKRTVVFVLHHICDDGVKIHGKNDQKQKSGKAVTHKNR